MRVDPNGYYCQECLKEGRDYGQTEISQPVITFNTDIDQAAICLDHLKQAVQMLEQATAPRETGRDRVT